MANYALLASSSTVQVLSPSVVQDVVYVTISTSPSNVIVSFPLYETDFDAGASEGILTSYAEATEAIMSDGKVIAGQGVQTIDPNGLLQDQVAFTVEYVPPDSSGTSITAAALVPTQYLAAGTTGFGEALFPKATAIIDATYANLQTAAGG